MSKKIDYLTEDTINPSNQKYVCVSFLTPEKEDGVTLSGIKFRGCFETYEDACAHAKKLQEVDEYFNVYVGEVGKWLPFDPNPDSEYVKNSEYANEKLNNIMKKYQENQEKSKLFHEHQKNEQIKKNLDSNIEQRNKSKEEIESEMRNLEGREKEKLISNLKALEEQIKTMEDRKQELEDINKGISIKLKMDQKDNSEITV